MRTFDTDIPVGGAVLSGTLALPESDRAPGVLPGEQFRHVTCPSFVVHGADDLNVPVEDAFDTVRALWRAGNRDVEVCVLPHADHSFQATSDDADQGLRDRLSMESFRRPFHQRYPEVIVKYLRRAIRPAGYAVA